MKPARALVAAATLFCATLASRAEGPVVLDLGGDWSLSRNAEAESISARVPGNVHTDLLAAGKIPDPFYRDSERQLRWIVDSTWTYRRDFEATDALLQQEKVVLRCEGLDTVAVVSLNGRELARTDDMFRTFEFDVKGKLRPGRNTVEVRFLPAFPYIDELIRNAPKGPNTSVKGLPMLRKARYSDGWDFGPRLPTAGIYRPISLVGWTEARLTGVAVDQDLSDPARARLGVSASADVSGAVRVVAKVSLRGREVASASADVGGGAAKATLEVPSPELWWPAGMGGQPLYDVDVELVDAAGKVVDRTSRRIGLRKVELLPKTADRPLRLAVNGREMYCKGACWIPCDMFSSRVSVGKLRRYVDDAAAVNMNMLRMWGGGYYEDDAFYDACDERGILVWQEFGFACTAYPGMNPAFADNVRAEVRDLIARLRHHPCVAVWCGNNEVEGVIKQYGTMSIPEYDHLFHDLIGGEVKKALPGARYVGGSPEQGDEHNWWVWHVGAGFEKYRESHGWMTEFGFQSFPVPETVASYTTPGDRASVLTDVMKFHQRNGNGKGNEMILDQMARYFRKPKDLESTLWLSQINQAYGMGVGIEHWRTDWPRSSGSLVWQYDDCWPGPTWSSVDYFGRWKALQYELRRAYAPAMVTGKVDPREGTVAVAIASDLRREADARLTWALTDTAGRTLDAGKADVRLPAGTASVAGPTLKLAGTVGRAGRRNVLLWLALESPGLPTSRKLVTFAKFKDLNLADPGLAARATPADGGVDVRVSAKAPALYAWVTCDDPDARYSDNFVSIPAGGEVTVHVTPFKPGASIGNVRVRSLYDASEPVPPVEPTITVGPDGVLRAAAEKAEIIGTSAHLEDGNPPNIGGWTDASDVLAWSARDLPPGKYRVSIETACPRGGEGATFEVAIGSRHLSGKVPATQAWSDYATMELGTVNLTADDGGRLPLELRVIDKPHAHVMNVRAIALTPIR